MAAVHPSRMGLVPASSLPQRPASPQEELSREEQLKQQLLSRRKPSSRSNGTSTASISIRGRAEGAGRELIDVENHGESSTRGLFGESPRARYLARSRSRSPPPPRSDDERRYSPRRTRRDEWDPSPRRDVRRRLESPTRRSSRFDHSDRNTDSYDDRHERTRRDQRWDEKPQLPLRPEYEAAPNVPLGGGMHPDRMRMIHGNRPPPARSSYPPQNPPPTLLPPLRFPTFPPPNQPFHPTGPPSGDQSPASAAGSGDVPAVVNAPNWAAGAAPPPRRIGFGGGLDFEKRRLERERSSISIWPPSPKEPWRDPEEVAAERREAKKAAKRAKADSKARRRDNWRSSRKRRTRRYTSETPSSSDTEAESDRDSRSTTRRKHRRRRRRYSDESSSDNDSNRSMPDDRHKPTRSRTRDAISPLDEDDAWVEKKNVKTAAPALPRTMAERDVLILPATVPDGESDDEVGPQLPSATTGKKEKYRGFHDMLPGEAEAMAAYAAAGQRIPRRGEVGLDQEKITQFEESGYVMSGNRNKRMNAVRLRKENQVISAEEKRAILNLQREERVRKEGAIISQFKELMDQNLRKQGLNKG